MTPDQTNDAIAAILAGDFAPPSLNDLLSVGALVLMLHDRLDHDAPPDMPEKPARKAQLMRVAAWLIQMGAAENDCAARVN